MHFRLSFVFLFRNHHGLYLFLVERPSRAKYHYVDASLLSVHPAS